MGLKSITTHVRKRGLKDIFSKRFWTFLSAQRHGFTGMKIPQEEVLTYSEQVVYRTIMCSACVKAGACRHCGCDMKTLLPEKSGTCSEGKWGEMMGVEAWNAFKKEHGLKFELKDKYSS